MDPYEVGFYSRHNQKVQCQVFRKRATCSDSDFAVLLCEGHHEESFHQKSPESGTLNKKTSLNFSNSQYHKKEGRKLSRKDRRKETSNVWPNIMHKLLV